MTVAILADRDLPPSLGDTYAVYVLIKDGLVRPFSLEEIDRLPAQAVADMMLLSSVSSEVRQSKGTDLNQGGMSGGR